MDPLSAGSVLLDSFLIRKEIIGLEKSTDRVDALALFLSILGPAGIPASIWSSHGQAATRVSSIATGELLMYLLFI